jgi:hypothetical protein
VIDAFQFLIVRKAVCPGGRGRGEAAKAKYFVLMNLGCFRAGGRILILAVKLEACRRFYAGARLDAIERRT